MNYQTKSWAIGIVCLFLGICIGTQISRFGTAQYAQPVPRFVGYANESRTPVADTDIRCLPGIDRFLALRPSMTRAEVFQRVGFDQHFFASIGETQSKNEMSLSYRPPNEDGTPDEFGSIEIDFSYPKHRQSHAQDRVANVFIIAGSGAAKNGRIIESLCQ